MKHEWRLYYDGPAYGLFDEMRDPDAWMRIWLCISCGVRQSCVQAKSLEAPPILQPAAITDCKGSSDARRTL